MHVMEGPQTDPSTTWPVLFAATSKRTHRVKHLDLIHLLERGSVEEHQLAVSLTLPDRGARD